MSAPVKLAAFVLGLAALFGVAVGVGSAVGPVGPLGAAAADDGHDDGPAAAGGHGAGSGAEPAVPAHLPKGLQVAQDGYALDLTADALPAGPATPASFRILGPDGAPVREYETTHDEDLHLIAVRRDLTGFQHVHPERAADGTWRTTVALRPGPWRLFADFTPAGTGRNLTLGADLAVAGDFAPQPLPPPSATAEVDGYAVTLEGDLVSGRETELTLTVTRDGRPVTDLQPYLAAYGHLVVLRDGDLAYLHVHPVGEPGDGATAPGPRISFATTAPSAGSYRLFLDFRHGDVVRTAAFTAVAGNPQGGHR